MWTRIIKGYGTRARSLASRKDASQVLFLAEDTFLDPTVAGILADLIDEEYPATARCLREDYSTGALVEAMWCGDWRARECASAICGVVAMWAMQVGSVRRQSQWEPFDSVGAAGVGIVSRPEELAFPQDDEGRIVYPCVPGRIARYTRRSSHCMRLLWNGLYGWPIPNDCEAALETMDIQIFELIRRTAA